MSGRRFVGIFFVIIFFIAGRCNSLIGRDTYAQNFLELAIGNNNTLSWKNKLKIEGFYSRNARMLNDDNGGLDKIVFPGKFTYDTKFSHSMKHQVTKANRVNIKGEVRFKGVFGAPESAFKTAFSTIRDSDSVVGAHRHAISINVPTLRLLELDILLNDLFHMPFVGEHRFSMGLFPFSMGRGIALGDAYATVPDLVGYDPASSVEQYAPGFKFSGPLASDHRLDYDVYVGILDNKSDSFDAVNEHVYGQMYGKHFDQARGFGIMNYVIAGRLKFKPFDDAGRMLCLEPYALFNDQREQRIEVAGDATAKLGTIGVAAEATLGAIEFGFDSAFNLGTQYVNGLDRNVVQRKKDKDGYIRLIYSKVKQVVDPLDPTKDTDAPFNDTNRQLVDVDIALAGQQSKLAHLNKQVVSLASSDVMLRNASDRYRDPYRNTFHGSMFVCDVSYKFTDPSLKIAGTAGFASGGENPNFNNNSAIDGVFNGFIGLQEIYSGKRVRSAFILSGRGSIPRITSIPRRFAQESVTTFPQLTSRFTNLMFTGASVAVDRELCNSTWKINPNLMFFWQDHPSRITGANRPATGRARLFLGTEANIFVDVQTAPGLKCFVVGGAFVPGGHYEDIAGRPLNRREQAFLDSRDRTGTSTLVDRVPVMGHNTAYFVNAGFEYEF